MIHGAVDHRDAAGRIIGIAREAGDIVMRIYATKFGVDYKGEHEPVTEADQQANRFICDALARAYPGVPVVAEESDPACFEGYSSAAAAWFVDPLDGTAEFVARNGEFAVMIGLAERGRATLGVIVWPTRGRSFVGIKGAGAFEVTAAGQRRPIHVSATPTPCAARVLVSRSHRPPGLERVIARLGAIDVMPCGSAGVKAARVATGEADIYLQIANAGSLWDSCAPEALVTAAGGVVTDAHGRPFDYTSPNLRNRSGFVISTATLHDAVLKAVADVAPP